MGVQPLKGGLWCVGILQEVAILQLQYDLDFTEEEVCEASEASLSYKPFSTWPVYAKKIVTCPVLYYWVKSRFNHETNILSALVFKVLPWTKRNNRNKAVTRCLETTFQIKSTKFSVMSHGAGQVLKISGLVQPYTDVTIGNSGLKTMARNYLTCEPFVRLLVFLR